jgi:hypothetical protein
MLGHMLLNLGNVFLSHISSFIENLKVRNGKIGKYVYNLSPNNVFLI